MSISDPIKLRLAVPLFVSFLLLQFPVSASAVTFESGKLSGSVDTTLTYGSGFRMSTADSQIIGLTADAAGAGLTGTAFSENSDDANQNYNDGLISNVGKFTTEVDLSYGNFGLFTRFNGFKDYENKDAGDRTALTRKADRLVTENINLQDLYIWADFDIGSMPASIRAGEQVLSWGESSFIQNGINIINPFDVSKLRTPGSQIKDALIPVGMVSFSIAPTNNVSFEGFYQYDWERTVIEPVGSYFSTNDFVGDGGRKVILGFGAASDRGTNVLAAVGGAANFGGLNALLAASGLSFDAFDEDFLGVARIEDNQPGNGGEFGFALKYYSEELNDTEFGLYFINHHSRTPIISARTGSAAGVAGAAAVVGAFGTSIATAAYAQTANYFIEYPDDIQRIGLSFNTQVKGIAFQGEYTLIHDAPLQVDDIELLFAALCPINATLGTAPGFNQIAPGCTNIGTDQRISGFIERNVSQIQVTATKVLGPVAGANQGVLIGEVGVTHVHNMPNKSDLRLNGAGTFTSGNTFHATTGLHQGKAAESADHFADATSWGFRMAGRLTYNNLVGSVNISPGFALSQDVSGITPGPGGNFLEGRRAITLGVSADYQNEWYADLAYTSFQGAGRYNLLNDRDFMAMSLSYSF